MQDLMNSANSQVLAAALATARVKKDEGVTYIASSSIAIRNIISTFINVLGYEEQIRVVPLQ